MTIAFSSADDLIVPSVAGQTYLGGAGNDTYVISNLAEPGDPIIINDTEGDNILQLVNGLTISSSVVYENALQITLSNGGVVQILSASDFDYDVGGNVLTGASGTLRSYSEFVVQELGTTIPTEAGESNSGGAVEIGSSSPPVPEYTTVSADIGEISNAAPFDASGDGFKFTEDPNVANYVEISNFTSNDLIEVTEATTLDYNFSNDGANVDITLVMDSTVSRITLVGVVDSGDLVYDEASFEAAIGFDAFTVA